MLLHQFLRFIHDAVPLMLFNIKGSCIASVRDKQDIDINLYEERILDIGLGASDKKGCGSAIYITLEK